MSCCLKRLPDWNVLLKLISGFKFRQAEKKCLPVLREAWVAKGARTLDPQNHNLML